MASRSSCWARSSLRSRPVFLARALGPGDYGTYALAMSVGALLALPADFGISPSAQRFVAEHVDDRRAVARGPRRRVPAQAADRGTRVAVALAVAAGPIADAYDNPGLAWPLRAAALALFCESFVMLSTGAFIALGRVTYNLRLLPLGLVALVLTSSSCSRVRGATAAMLARAAGLALVGGAGAWLLWRLVGRPTVRLRGGSGRGRRRIAGYAGPIVLVDSAFALFSQLDVLLIGALLGSARPGCFRRPCGSSSSCTTPGTRSARPSLRASLTATVKAPPCVRSRRGLRVTILLQAGLAAVAGPVGGADLRPRARSRVPGVGGRATRVRAVRPAVGHRARRRARRELPRRGPAAAAGHDRGGRGQPRRSISRYRASWASWPA